MNLPCLDIIIPHYNEKPSVIRHLLDSIEGQVGVNLAKAIRVTIVNDCNDEPLQELVSFLKTSQYSFPIKILRADKNAGAGVARQIGINNTELPYIMFCDADDCLFSADALMKLINYINLLEVQQKPWSYIWSDFYEEQILDHGYNLLKHETPSMIWMHGKIWNRKFLEEHNCKFHPWLRTFEDTYFGKIVGLSGPYNYVKHCPEVTYLWKRNPNSVTANWTKDERCYLYWRNADFRECTYEVLKFIYPNRSVSGRWNELFFVSIFFTYFMLQMPDFDRRDEEAKAVYDALEEVFVRMVVDFGESVKNVTAAEKSRWYSLTRADLCSRFKFLIEQTPWNDFLKYIDKKYNINSYDLLCIK